MIKTIIDALTKPKPPKTVWQLVDLALNDMLEVERMEDHKINMNVWHEPSYLRPCEVCVAGSIMANTLHADSRDLIGPCNYGNPWRSRLLAINALRLGNLTVAKHCWEPCGALTGVRVITPYETDREQFFVDMYNLRDEYKAIETK